jgi:hypothetical protein
MDSVNNNTKTKSSSIMTNGKTVDLANPKAVSKFDMSILGKIDLIEAEKIAGEEVLFLSEADLIEGLEDFELVPVKNYKREPESTVLTNNLTINDNFTMTDPAKIKPESSNLSEITKKEDYSAVSETVSDKTDPSDEFISNKDLVNVDFIVKDPEADRTISESDSLELIDRDMETHIYSDEEITEADKYFNDSPEITDEIFHIDAIEVIQELNDDIPDAKKLFSIKINEETLDAQLFSILNDADLVKIEDKSLEKYREADIDLKCRFADDQFLSRKFQEDTISYNEDLLTERLVKMIDVADGKMELLEISAKEGDYSNYILEDYTLYNSEKFDTVFKEEVFYTDSDFEFIENAIIRDDFTKYIHEIDDYFESEDSLIQSEISEILGLIPDEKEYIDDKLFGDYYKKFDLDNEIDFIKPEIDFFRSNYTGTKNLNYFTKIEDSISESEKISIEEDISSANAIVFEEDISEIEEILLRDFNFKPDAVTEKVFLKDITLPAEKIPDITDKIIILEDKDKLYELASEFPEKHENLIKLLSYLDGLFEKLPEEVIRKFAESEYFELYSKVLKEIGV